MEVREDKLALPSDQEGALWRYRAAAAPAVWLHRHAELEVNLVTRGRGAYLVHERRYELRPGTVIWLFPAAPHVLVDRSSDLAMWIGVFRPRLVRRLCRSGRNAPLRRRDHPGRISKQARPEDLAPVADLCQQLGGAHEAGHTDRLNAGLGYLLLTAWHLFLTAPEGAPPRDVHPAVERAARALRDDPTLPLPELARRCALSASRLSRLFSQQAGLSLTDYRNRVRLDRFLSLYGQGHRRNITQAALAAGFGSYPQFHRVFRQHMNQSPADYRRTH